VVVDVSDNTRLRRWLLAVVAILPLTVLWSLANPLFAAPDEPSHMARAQGVLRGEWSGPYTTDGLPLAAQNCFATLPEVTAGCMDTTWGQPGTVAAVTGTDDYPPLLHLVAGTASTVAGGEAGAYAMRIAVAVVVALVWGWAAVVCTRPGVGPWPLATLIVATTPMVLFTSGTVNPSGLTAAFAALYVSALLAWRPALAPESDTGVPPDPERSRWWPAVVVGALGLIGTRRDGLLWLALVSITLLPILDLHLPARLRRHRTAAMAAAGVVVVAVVVGAVRLGTRFASWQSGEGTPLAGSVRTIRRFFLDLIGNFGWLDTQIPPETFALSLIVVAFVVGLALVTGDRRHAVSMVALLAVMLVAMVGFETLRNAYLQGRYLFPLWFALVLVAGSALAAGDLTRRATARAVGLVLGLWAVVHAVAFAQNLRRYSVGANGPWSFLTGGGAWDPPSMPTPLAMALYLVALAWAGGLFGVLVVRRLRGPRSRPAAPSAPG